MCTVVLAPLQPTLYRGVKWRPLLIRYGMLINCNLVLNYCILYAASRETVLMLLLDKICVIYFIHAILLRVNNSKY